MKHRKWLLIVFRLIVGGVFVWAGVLKIADPLGFAQSITNYRIFPQGVAFFTALVLPWTEVLCGAFLIIGLLQRSSSLIIAFLLAGFIGLVSLALLRGIDTSCGCFGSLSRKADFTLVLTDVVLLFMALSIFFRETQGGVLRLLRIADHAHETRGNFML